MKNLNRLALLFGLLTLLCAANSFAKCRLSVNEVEAMAARVKWQNRSGAEENTAVLQAGGTIARNGKAGGYTADYEAFVRPDRDESFQILPIPLFIVHMEKNHDAVYVCAHYDSVDLSKSVSVVYFLRDDKFHPVSPMPLPFSEFKKFFLIKNTPLMFATVPLGILAKIQTVFIHGFGDLTKIGIDRMRITSTQIEIASGGDPTQFDRQHSVLHKILPLKGPPLQQLP